MQEHIQVIADKCLACRRCEVACIAAHHGLSFKEAMKQRDVLVSRVRAVKTDDFKTTVSCHQCSPAPCCNICPTGALQQESDGAITMRVQLCVACKMCLAVCPYGVISLETIGMPDVSGDAETVAQRTRREVAVRCDMCKAWREVNGKKITACMEVCPARALSMVMPDGSVVEAPVEKKAKKAVEDKPAAEAPAAAPKAEEAPQPTAEAQPVLAEAPTAAPKVEEPSQPKAEEQPAPAEAPAAAPAEAEADAKPAPKRGKGKKAKK